MRILTAESDFLREIFIESFVDTSSKYYQPYILDLHSFSDGLCYTGFLWDCMTNFQVVSQNFILDFLERRTTDIYVLWDIHSRDRIFIENYWKYPKRAVLSFSPCELADILPTLPEDCYFFDASLAWAAVLTSEVSTKNRRLCLFVGNG